MAAEDKAFVGSVPANYEKLLVPMIFAPYAREMAGRIERLKPKDVLEVAAGTGVLTRAMASALDPDVRITATDLNQPMLDIAMERQGQDGRIAWQQADGLALPFADGGFDVVACQFGVMFFPDKVKGFGEARRVLRPDGRFVFDVWDRIENNAFIAVVNRMLAEMFPADPPRFMERLPHGYWDRGLIESDLRAAGFSSVDYETVEHTAHAASALDAATGYFKGSPLGAEIEARLPREMDNVVERATEVLVQHFGSGPIEGKIQAHIITASL